MAATTIKSFLVAIGYKHDEASLKNVIKGIGTASKAVVEFAAAVEASALSVAVGVARFASNLEALYFASMRTGTAASSLKAFDRAAQDFGASAGEAVGAIESLATAFRNNPIGLKGAFRDFMGVEASADMGKNFAAIAAKFKANKHAGMEMLNTQIAQALQMNISPKLQVAMTSEGFDAEAAAKSREFFSFEGAFAAAHKFKVSLRNLENELWKFAARLSVVMDAKLAPMLDKISAWFDKHGNSLATSLGDAVIYVLAKLDQLIDWWSKNGPDIQRNIHQVITVMRLLGAATWVIIRPLIHLFLWLNEVTNGWSTSLLAVFLILKRFGALQVIKLLFGLGGAEAGLTGVAALTAGFTALLPIVIAIGAAIAAWKIYNWGENNSLSETLQNAFKPKDAAGTGTGSVLNDPFETKDVRDHITHTLMLGGLPRAVAMGLAVNAMAESSGNPQADNFYKGKHYLGLFQWSPEKQKEYTAWAKNAGMAHTDLHDANRDEQAFYAAHELRNSTDPKIRLAWQLAQAHTALTAQNVGINTGNYANLVERADTNGATGERRKWEGVAYEQKVEINVYGVPGSREVADHVRVEMQKQYAQMTREFVAMGLK